MVETTLAELPALRRQPGNGAGREISARFLRFADEQTVVGLAAVVRAMNTPPLEGVNFHDWGVLAAPQLMGRLAGAEAFEKFQREGIPALSPHIIPQQSLHSVASAISVALGMHGPNFGIGGGREAVVEGLLVAISSLAAMPMPGVWLVLTEWTPEPVPDNCGSWSLDAICRGVAMALVVEPRGRYALRFLADGPEVPPPRNGAQPPNASSRLTHLAAALGGAGDTNGEVCWSCPIPGTGVIELISSSPARLSER